MADITKNAGEVVRIQPTTFEGHDLVDVRVYFRAYADDGQPELRPTKKGVCFKRELLPDVIATLTQIPVTARGTETETEGYHLRPVHDEKTPDHSARVSQNRK